MTELVFERLVFEIHKEEKNDAPPRRKEISIWYLDGSLYEGPLVSASAWGSFDRCQRIWAFDKIDKVPRVEKSYQKEGKRLHEELLEGWLLRREMPASRSILDGGVMRLFPAPRKGLRAEECFVLRVYVKRKRGEGVAFWGFKDCEYEVDGKPRVNDLKTTSDLRWRKTPGELQNDVQCVVYAADRLAEHPHTPEIQMDWVYMTRNKPYKSETTKVTISRALMLEKMLGFLPVAQEIQKTLLRANKIPRIETEKGSYAALSFPASVEACQMFGGCDYKKQRLCLAGEGLKGLRSHFKQDKESRHKKKQRRLLRLAPADKQTKKGQQPEERKMGLLEDLAKGASPEVAAKVAAGKESAETVAIDPAEPPEAKAPKPPRKGDDEKSAAGAVQAAVSGKPGETLAGLVRQARGEPSSEEEKEPSAPTAVAEGINPPDARDPEEVQKEAATPKETAAAKKKREKAEKEAASTPSAAEGAPAGRPAGSRNKKTTLAKAFILLVDAVPLKGVQAEMAEELISPSRTTVETDAGKDYRMIQFDGPKMLGAQLLEDLQHQELKGFFYVSSKTTEKEVLDSLIRCADVVVKGGF